MCINGLTGALLVVCNGSEETVQVLVDTVVVFVELLETLRQIGTDGGRVVPLQGRGAELELVVLVI